MKLTRNRRPFSRDKMLNTNRFQVAYAAMGTIDGVQSFDKEVQPLGMAVAFIMMCEVYGVSVNDVFTAANNIIVHTEAKDVSPEIRAVRQYIKEEIA